ncbi:MAG: DEAD/DEAH box helicase [Candidatus Promineifilaceae bacterium]|nr:DEAD/DEAH box helicase [Anaerolineaceae bacterium]
MSDTETIETEENVNEPTVPTLEDAEIEEPEDSLPSVHIGDLPPRLAEATARAGWRSLTPVQSKAMPYIFAQRPMMVQARTGSGKTGAFIMPIMELVNRFKDETQALVLVPTRELATQVVAEATLLFGDSGFRVTAVYGGVGYGPQLKALREGTHLIVGTPGRVLDHLLRGSLSLKNLKVLVFDEADRMLSMGFYPDMRRVQEYLPGKVYTCMFSATFPPTVRSLARQFMDKPDFLSLSRDHVHVADTSHQTVTVSSLEKDRTLIRLIELENPDSAIIFCNTKQRVHYVSVVLQRFGYNADELSGDLAQKDREKVMDKLRKGKLRFCVATDVAARGIDISGLSHVFQYELPEDPEIYIHRAGRTGRAGATGTAISLVGDFSEQVQLKKIAKQYNIVFEERPSPDEAALAEVVSERMTVQLEAQMRDRDKLRIERLQRFVPMVKELANDDEGVQLVAMLLDDLYQQTLHSPPASVEEDTPAKRDDTDRSDKPKQTRRRSRSRSRN